MTEHLFFCRVVVFRTCACRKKLSLSTAEAFGSTVCDFALPRLSSSSMASGASSSPSAAAAATATSATLPPISPWRLAWIWRGRRRQRLRCLLPRHTDDDSPMDHCVWRPPQSAHVGRRVPTEGWVHMVPILFDLVSFVSDNSHQDIILAMDAIDFDMLMDAALEARIERDAGGGGAPARRLLTRRALGQGPPLRAAPTLQSLTPSGRSASKPKQGASCGGVARPSHRR